MKCIHPSGKVLNYPGLKFQFGANVGAKIEYSELAEPYTSAEGKVGVVILDGKGDNNSTDHLVLGFGKKASWDRQGQALGIGVFSDESVFGLGIRFLNGIRNWSYIINQL